MSIWCKSDPGTCPDGQDLLMSVGTLFKKLAKLPEKYKCHYQLHEKALKHDLDNEAMLTV